VQKSEKLAGFEAKAWAMRDTFDGLIDVIERKGGGGAPPAPSAGGLPPVPARAVPTHQLALLKDCSPEAIRYVEEAIGKAIEIGAPLYNKGNFEACYRVYEGAALEIDHRVPRCTGAKRALHDGIREAGN